MKSGIFSIVGDHEGHKQILQTPFMFRDLFSVPPGAFEMGYPCSGYLLWQLFQARTGVPGLCVFHTWFQTFNATR